MDKIRVGARLPEHLCHGCDKLNDEFICVAYGVIGMEYRNRIGQCPLDDRWADWRTDKPKIETQKVRIGQQKGRK